MGLGLKMDLWSEYADTPFWISIVETKKGWSSTEKFKRNCEKIAFNLNHKFVEINNEIFFSLKPKTEVTEDVVIKDLADKIEQIYKELEEYTTN